MSGDVTYQALKRLTWLPEREAADNGNVIAGQEYDNVYIQGGEIDNVTMTGITASGTFTGNIIGNADTATALLNARTIGGVSFNGTANIVPQTIQIIDAAADTTTFPILATAATGSLQPTTDAGLSYNASTNALTTTTFIGALTGNADTATTATTATNVTNITLANEASDTTCFPVFVTAATGNLPPKTNTSFTFNSSTGAFAATSLGGTLTTAAQTNITSVGTLTGGATGTGFTVALGTSTITGQLGLSNGGTGANYASNALLFAGIKQGATSSATGVVELATDAELQTGTDTTRAVTSANIKNSLGFSDYFESSQQTITAAGALTIAHSLGRKPILFQTLLVCATGELNYTAGDEVIIPEFDTSASAGGLGISLVPDATNLNVRFGSGSGGNVFLLLNKTTGAVASATNANWRLVLRAWA